MSTHPEPLAPPKTALDECLEEAAWLEKWGRSLLILAVLLAALGFFWHVLRPVPLSALWAAHEVNVSDVSGGSSVTWGPSATYELPKLAGMEVSVRRMILALTVLLLTVSSLMQRRATFLAALVLPLTRREPLALRLDSSPPAANKE